MVGNVGIGPDGKLDLKAGAINGTLFVDLSAENKNPRIKPNGGTVIEDLYQAAADARNASEDAANLNPTQTFKDIKEGTEIVRSGELTVVEVKKTELKTGLSLTAVGHALQNLLTTAGT